MIKGNDEVSIFERSRRAKFVGSVIGSISLVNALIRASNWNVMLVKSRRSDICKRNEYNIGRDHYVIEEVFFSSYVRKKKRTGNLGRWEVNFSTRSIYSGTSSMD